MVVLLAVALASAIEVHSATECPNAEAVSRRLRSLIPGTTEGGSPHHALLDVVDGGISVSLVGSDNVTIASRRLEKKGSCEELAETVAVVIATWAADVRPGVLPEHKFRMEPTTLSRAEPTPSAEVSVDVGAGVLAMLGAGSTVAAVMVEGILGRPETRLALRLGGVGSSHERSLAAGRFGWRSALLYAAPTYRLSFGRTVLVELHAGISADVVTATGDGYSVDRRSSGVAPGALAGARVALRSGWMALWAGALGTTTFQARTATVSGSSDRRALARSALLVGGGIAVGTFR
jgi:hypothetical protein